MTRPSASVLPRPLRLRRSSSGASCCTQRCVIVLQRDGGALDPAVRRLLDQYGRPAAAASRLRHLSLSG
ncbi:MAG: hypothetical protein M3Z24_14075 [Chloroflexota bacterium]|nr:hypothetical protein [Chloroflexota bacterium]